MEKEKLRHLFTTYSSRVIIGIITILCIFIYLFATRNHESGTDVKIALISLMTIVLSYFFGSSKDSSDRGKTEQVKDLAEASKPESNAS